MATIEERLRDIVVSELKVDPERVTREVNFLTELGADSLHLLQLTIAVEDEFGLVILDKERTDVLTFGQLVDFVTARVEPGDHVALGRHPDGDRYDLFGDIEDEDFDRADPDDLD